MSYLVAVGGVQAAPAVRVGYSWASNNLRLIQTYTTMSCLLFVCVNLILGQAQLVVRGVRAARLWPTRRYPATDGEHGRDYVAPQAARNLPVPPTADSRSL